MGIVLGQKLQARQVQSLALTQHMQQSLHMLQMTTAELRDFLLDRAGENPFMELSDMPALGEDPIREVRYENIHSGKDAWQGNSADGLNNIANRITLKEHLSAQICTEITGARDRIIALRCTDALDESGYLSESIQSIAASIGCTIENVEQVLQGLRNLEPTGVYARNLAECLEIQLCERGIYDEVFREILKRLEMLARLEFAKLAKECGVDMQELQKRIAVIKRLEPKPGRNFFSDEAQMLVPDAYIAFDYHGELAVKLNESYLPSVKLDTSLYRASLNSTYCKDELNFCKHKFQEGLFIVRAIAQRASTLYKIISRIVVEQREFFEKGVNFLKPMVLSDIATACSLHESTVSRASNKVISSPMGTFEIKYFFSSKIKSNFAENTYSSTAIKSKIKEIIHTESPNNILSDDHIAEALQLQGIGISRRTVTKYREALSLPSSHERRKRALL